MSGRNHYEGMHILALEIRMVKLVKSVNENIDTLVLPLITSADADEHGILHYILAAHGRCHLHKLLPCRVTLGGILLISSWSEARLKSVRSHHVHRSSEELAAFLGSYITYGRKNVTILSRLLLEGMPCHHVEVTCLLIRIIACKPVIQRQVIAGDAPSDYGGMCREHSCHRHIGRLQIKESGTGHPLMELGNNPVRRLQVIFIEALYYPSGSIAEKRGLTVVPVAGKGIDPESCPEFSKNPVLHSKELLEIHKDCSRAARNVPSADTDSETL